MYHQHVVAAATFSKINHLVWSKLWRWAQRRHPQKGVRRIKARYFQRQGLRETGGLPQLPPCSSWGASCCGSLGRSGGAEKPLTLLGLEGTTLASRHRTSHVRFLPGSKARKPYEFGVKVSLAVTHAKRLIVDARSFPGSPYDRHTLAAQLKQTATLLQNLNVQSQVAVADLGYRGVDAEIALVKLIHRSTALAAQDHCLQGPQRLF